jgi:glycosyltransferase involved in cell wall biosynthesis
MKILLVIDHLGAGGAQRQLVQQANILASYGHDIVVLTYVEMRGVYQLDDRVQYVSCHIPRNLCTNVMRIIRIRQIVRKIRPTWVIAFLDIPSALCRIALIGLHGTKFSASKRVEFNKRPLVWPFNWLWRFVYRRANVVTCNSPIIERQLIEKFPEISRKVKVIDNIVDAGNVQIAQRVSQESNNFKIMCVGRVVREKDPVTIAAAVNQLVTKGNRISVDWYGEKLDQDLVGEVESQMVGLEGCWNWRGVDSDILTKMNDYDLFVHASTIEGTPNAVIEAMVGGMVMVLSDIEANRSLIERVHGVARFFNVANPISLEQALEDVIENYAEYCRCRPINSARAKYFFSAKRVGQQLNDIFF